jgi:DNA-directed RNA polymerase specialized sigma24 family protein
MTKTQFNQWLERKYPRLKVAAMRLDPVNGEDLLHDTIVSVLANQTYLNLPTVTDNAKGRMFWFYAAIGNKHIDRKRKRYTQQVHDDKLMLEEEEYDPIGEYTAKILFQEVWPQLGEETQRFLLDTVLEGYTAKEAHNRGPLEHGIEYSNYLKRIKADLERVKL